MHPILRSRITTVILCVLALWLVALAVISGIRTSLAARELEQLRMSIDDGRRENDRVAAQLERMRQPAWLALLARQRLNYKHPEETVAFVYKSDKTDIVPPSHEAPRAPIPYWRQWLDWLRGAE